MIEYEVKENDAGQRVDKFINKLMPSLPKSYLYKAIRNKKIKVNRKRCEISTKLEVGDKVICFLPPMYYEIDEDYPFLHVPSKLDVVYEDDEILIINKPVGLLSHKDQKDIQDNVQDRILHYLYQKKEYDPKTAQSFTPAIVHRLDRNTSGLLIAAKNVRSERLLNEMILNHRLKKYYLCIVEGKMNKTSDSLTLYLYKDRKSNRSYISNKPKDNYVMIQMNYQVKEIGKKYSLVEVELISGKSHQIRSVMAYLHHPLYGDVKYGASNVNEYQALCSYRLYFDFDDIKLSHQSIELPNCHIKEKFGLIEKSA